MTDKPEFTNISDPDARDITFFPKDGMRSTTVQTAILESNRNTSPHEQNKDNPHDTKLANLLDTGIEAVPAKGDTLHWDGTEWINTPKIDIGPISQNTFKTLYKTGKHFWPGGLWQDPTIFALFSLQVEGFRHYPSKNTQLSAYASYDGGISWRAGVDEKNDKVTLFLPSGDETLHAAVGGDLFGDLGVLIFTQELGPDNLTPVTGTRKYYTIRRDTLNQKWGSPIPYSPPDMGFGTDKIGYIYGQFIYNNTKTAVYVFSYTNHRVYWTRTYDGIDWTSGVAIDNANYGSGRPYPNLNVSEVSVFPLNSGYGMIIRNRHESGNMWTATSPDMENWSEITELGYILGNNPVIGLTHDDRVYLYLTSRSGAFTPINNTVNTNLVLNCSIHDFPNFGEYAFHSMLEDRYIGYFTWYRDANGLMWATSICGEIPHENATGPSEAKLVMHSPLNSYGVTIAASDGQQTLPPHV